MVELNEVFKRVKAWFSGDFKMKLVVLLGLAGMALILISQFMGTDKPQSKQPDIGTAAFTSEAYTAELETKLTDLIAGIDGVGRVRVMVTLENAGETVYAQEEKRNVDRQQEAGTAEAVGKVYQKENVEQKYILVEGESGRREALVKTQLQPKIQGVVIVCDGADNIRVEQNLINVVTTALNVPSTRVCVVKISK